MNTEGENTTRHTAGDAAPIGTPIFDTLLAEFSLAWQDQDTADDTAGYNEWFEPQA